MIGKVNIEYRIQFKMPHHNVPPDVMGFCYVYDEDEQVLKGVEYPRPSDIRSSNGK